MAKNKNSEIIFANLGITCITLFQIMNNPCHFLSYHWWYHQKIK